MAIAIFLRIRLSLETVTLMHLKQMSTSDHYQFMLFKKNGIQYTSFLNLLIKLLSEFNYKVILGDFFLTNQIIQALRFNLNTEEYTSADVFAI